MGESNIKNRLRFPVILIFEFAFLEFYCASLREERNFGHTSIIKSRAVRSRSIAQSFYIELNEACWRSLVHDAFGARAVFSARQ